MNNSTPLASIRMELPIFQARQAIISAITAHQVIIVAGDTGSGKTTQLPQMCLAAGRGQTGMIGCTQPRRLAATTIAKRVALELGEQGGMVGHKIRFQDHTTKGTCIKFMTDGILLAEANSDRLLSRYDTIIIDEAHERSLNIDFLLGIMQALLKKRPELKLIITSATIDTHKFSKAFNDAPIIEVTGRTFPVTMHYQEETNLEEAAYVDLAVEAAVNILESAGLADMLIFMPTERDIRETVDSLARRLPPIFSQNTPLVLPLYGRLGGGDQGRVFTTQPRSKIVVATNVAETSLTVPGIRYVIDTGLARILSYNPRARTTKLPVTKISQASCDQRAGRCGRVGPGICVRLFSQEDYDSRPLFTSPEIQRSNLAEVILRMIHLRLGEPHRFPFIDPPSGRAIRDGYGLLTELGALDKEQRLTAHGKIMTRLPLDPRLSRMIIAARAEQCLREIIIITAALSLPDPRLRPVNFEQQADSAHGQFSGKGSDFIFYLVLWQHYLTVAKRSASQARKFCKKNFLSYQRMREWRDIHSQISNILVDNNRHCPPHLHFTTQEQDASYDQVHRAILAGNLRHIGFKKTKNIYLGAGQKELMIFPGSNLFDHGGQWLMAAELVETSRLFARTVATIQPQWLEPLAGELCKRSYSDPHWQKKRGQVMVKEKVTLFGLVIVPGRLVSFATIDPDQTRQIFLQTALVEDELGGNFPFLRHNQQLQNDLLEMEERTRTRVVDDADIYAFYDHRLPNHVSTRQSLARFIKKQGQDLLLMTREDLLRASHDEQLQLFPPQLNCGELTFKLNYCFDPGGERDGISVQIPRQLAAYAQGEYFEWLVPGLLAEKVTRLLRSLPKSLRRKLVPIPHSAAQLVKELRPYEGNLFRQLEQIIHQKFNLKIEPQMWQPAQLPAHLQMRFEFIEGDSKIKTASRDPQDLHHLPDTTEIANMVDLSSVQHLERSGITTWDFADLPTRLTITDNHNNLTGFAFPGLVQDGQGAVAIRLFSRQEEQQRQCRDGLLYLYRLQFPKKCRPLRQDFQLSRKQWPLYEGLGSHEDFNNDLFNFVLRTIFACHSATIPSQEHFTEQINRVRQQGIYPMGKDILRQVELLLGERRTTLQYINELEEKGKNKKFFGVSNTECRNFRQETNNYFPPHFLAKIHPDHLAEIPRYLRALRLRLQRKLQNPTKDNQRQKQLAPFIASLTQARRLDNLNPTQRQEIELFAAMIEEFKISLFAQELKTRYPISAKRLTKKWQEISILLP